jgi:protease-4
VAERKGVVLVLVLIGAAVLMSVAGLLLLVALATGGEPAIASNSTLVIRLGGTLDERAPSGFSRLFTSPPTVREVVDSLRRAKTDPDISAVILAPGGTAPFWAKVQEIRDAVLDFKSSGKPIIGYLEYGGEQEYYLATACDRVYLMPTSAVELTGLASYELFLRGALDKIGAVPDMLHIGEYKTAANVYMDKTYTAAHREMAESLNNDLYGQIVAGIAEARGKTEAEVRAMFEHGPYLAKAALDAGLVDALAYRDEINDRAALPGDADRTVDFSAYRRGGETFSFTSRPRIAVVYAVGLIASGDSGTDPMQGDVVGSDTLARYLRRAREDRSIRAIVLRVDSPGGSAIAADAIWREMERTRSAKPLIVSMSDLAASGGYYIALPAHAIVAEPATLTGSIGVVVGKVAYGGTLDKLGLNLEAVSTGPYAQMDSPARPFTDAERKKMTEMMQATYDTFVQKVAEARHTTPAAIDAIARGRVWTGRQAKANGLVDELGGLTRAIALAKERAGLDPAADVSIVVYPPRKGLFETLVDPLASSRLGLAGALGADGRRALGLLTAPFARFRRGEPLAIMPNVYLR